MTPRNKLLESTRGGPPGDSCVTNCRVGRQLSVIEQVMATIQSHPKSQIGPQVLANLVGRPVRHASKPIKSGAPELRFANLGPKIEISRDKDDAYWEGLWV